MSVATNLTPATAARVKPNPGWSRFRTRLFAVLRRLAAGVGASKDYRLLNGMSAGQLRKLGLTHADIPRELHRRHFASLANAAESPD